MNLNFLPKKIGVSLVLLLTQLPQELIFSGPKFFKKYFRCHFETRQLLRPRKPEERIKEESVAEHVAQLRVLSDKGVETVYHVEVAVGVSAMLGYVGGLLGLWMGVSAMTMVDIGEWLARLMYKIRPRQNSTVHP